MQWPHRVSCIHNIQQCKQLIMEASVIVTAYVHGSMWHEMEYHLHVYRSTIGAHTTSKNMWGKKLFEMFFNLICVKCVYLIPFHTYNIFIYNHDFWDTLHNIMTAGLLNFKNLKGRGAWPNRDTVMGDWQKSWEIAIQITRLGMSDLYLLSHLFS
jgi:hypothetical protein